MSFQVAAWWQRPSVLGPTCLLDPYTGGQPMSPLPPPALLLAQLWTAHLRKWGGCCPQNTHQPCRCRHLQIAPSSFPPASEEAATGTSTPTQLRPSLFSCRSLHTRLIISVNYLPIISHYKYGRDSPQLTMVPDLQFFNFMMV